MKRLITSIMLLTGALMASAEIPDGYYQSLNGKKQADLKNAIYQLVHNFTSVSSYNALPEYFEVTDVRPGTDYWWDMYSDMDVHTYIRFGTYMNREHSFPKSWWGGSTTVKAYTDLNHLYPAEAKANQAKSNWPLGKVDKSSSVKFDNGITVVGYPVTGQGGGSQSVFEPADEYKGDFARTYFYMVTCYQDLTWVSKYAWMMEQNTYPTLKGWASKMLMEWHRQDPVSEKEENRNEAVYRIQNNRNPFIDHPELAEYLWGDKVGQAYNGGGTQPPTGDPNLITPVHDMSLDFGQVAVGRSTTSQLLFRGENLTGNFELIVSGADRKMFSIPSSRLSASLVNQPDGTWLTVTYTPTETGTHEASLIIAEGGIVGSRIVRLIGECLDVPTLTACTATAATDITADSYRANWTYPANETIDYWVINRTRYVGGSATAEEVIAEAPGFIIEDFDESDSESYSVQSVRLGYRSPASNVVFVGHSGITGVETDQGLVVQGFEGILRFVCSAEQTGACVYDISGKLVMFLDTIHNNMDVDIPAGIYFVTTDQCHTPVKVAVK